MIRVGIAGAAGYTAGELIRVLISHPQVELRYLQSESHRGEPVGRVHRDLIYTNLKFSDLDLTGIDVVHGTRDVGPIFRTASGSGIRANH